MRSFFLFGLFFVQFLGKRGLFQHVSFIVGEYQGGEGKSDDESHDAEQTAPDGEGEEDDGGIESCDFVHDAWGEHPVLDGLNGAEDNGDGEQDAPKTLPCVVGLEQGEQDGGHDADDLQVGNEVEHSDEEAKGNGEREVDDEESDAEEHTYTHGDDGLSTKVTVHAFLQVKHHGSDSVSVGFGHQTEKPFGHGFVVVEDEEEIDDADERGDEADDGADAAAEKGEELRHFFFEQLRHVLHGEGTGDFVEVDVVLDVVFHFGRDGGDGGVGGGVFDHDVLQMPHLRNNGGNDEVAASCDNANDEQEGDEDAEHTRLDTAAILDEGDDRVEEVGDEPCHQKGNEHIAETLDEVICGYQHDDADEDAHHAVEGEFFCDHNEVFVAI